MAIGRLRRFERLIQRDLDQLRSHADATFAPFLDFVAASVGREFKKFIGSINQVDGQLVLTSHDLIKQRNLKIAANRILLDAFNFVERREPRLFQPFVAAAKRARRRVQQMNRAFLGQFAFPEIDLAAVESAWAGVGSSIIDFNANMVKQLNTEISRHMLTGSPVKNLEASLADLNQKADFLAGKNRSDRFHRARAQSQIRAEMGRAYNEQMRLSAEQGGMTLFEHFGPIDSRNVTALGKANPLGAVNPKYAHLGSASFIGKVLNRTQWLSIHRSALTYGLHYGERGGFTPMADDWPGVREQWKASEEALGMGSQLT